jgi:2-amino-4-hydroxy-6-hydroxymethyldihydropteridine diphosphokinase
MENKNNRAFILLGSNLGDRINNLQNATDFISGLGIVLKCSGLYKTEPWQMNSNDWFVNQVLQVETSLKADALIDALLEIETELGRTRTAATGYESRIIDIDILYFNDEIIESERLTIPHPRMHLRKFTLMPLSEIAHDIIHPIKRMTSLQLLKACEDTSVVQRMI